VVHVVAFSVVLPEAVDDVLQNRLFRVIVQEQYGGTLYLRRALFAVETPRSFIANRCQMP
jgi:hypothetical protein